jgi:hypothetical protein
MPNDPNTADRASLRDQSLSRWTNEGGESPDVAPPHVPADAASTQKHVEHTYVDGPPQTNAEIVQLKVRMIALEGLLMALLADASPRQLALAKEMAGTISPRAGATPHRLTVQGAAQMRWLVERAQILREQAGKPAKPQQ